MVMYRVGSDLRVYESLGESWKISGKKFPQVIDVAKMFKAHGNLSLLKENKFLKGFVDAGKIRGARINILPDGTKLNKAYSLFAPNLKIHDEKSNIHWDAMFQNPCGTFCYLYSLEKNLNSQKAKYKKVEDFGKYVEKIERAISEDLQKNPSTIALAMATLMKTCMRVGNEIYYRKDGHKGLTTLKKKNIKIFGKKVCFRFIAKDGVPMTICETFSPKYIDTLKKILNGRKSEDFVFVDGKDKPLKDTNFEIAFEKYCGKRFYPHIVRSYFATSKAREFLKNKKSASKEEVKEFYNSVAEKLGHKKFSKKKGEWEDSFQVTIRHYIDPKLVEKINELVTKRL